MTYSIHGCSAVLHHPSSTTPATTVFSGENCSIMNSNVVSLKRKSFSPLNSPPSPKRVTLNSPPSSTSTSTTAAAATTTIVAGEDFLGPISPITAPSPKRVSEKSPFPTTTTAITAADEGGGPASISPITTPPPAFSPFSKRVSVKSPFSTTTTVDSTAAPPLPFSRFTKTRPSNNNKNLRRTLSEPPVFESFSDFCRYINSHSPENANNNSNSARQPLRRSISDPINADILVPAPLKPPPSKKLKEFLNEAYDKEEATVPENNEENTSNNSEILKEFTTG